MYLAPNPNIRIDTNCVSYPVLVPEEPFSQYLNTTDVLDNLDFPNYELALVDQQFNVVQDTIAGLEQDVLQGTEYRMYLDGVSINTGLRDGYYRFMIYDSSVANYDDIIYLSNEFELINDDRYLTETIKIKYRHYANIRNINYVGLPTFFNVVRLRITQPEPSTYEFKNAVLYRDTDTNEPFYQQFEDYKITSLETYWFDDPMHEATLVFMEHSNKFIVDYVNRPIEVRTESGLQPVQVNRASRLSTFKFEVYDSDFSRINRN